MIKDIISVCKGSFTEHTDLRVQEMLRCRVRLQDGRIIQNDYTESSGVSARVYKNGIFGFSSSADRTDSAVKAVLMEAERNAALMDKHVKPAPQRLPQIRSGSYHTDYEMKEIDRKYILELTREVDEYIRLHCPGISSRHVWTTTDSTEKCSVTSNGFDCHTLLLRSHVTVMLTAEAKGGGTVVLDDYYGTRGYADQVFAERDWLYEKIDKMYNELMLKREGVYTEAGYKDLILCPDLAGMLAHEAVGHTCEADMVLGGGIAGSYMDKPVASELVTLVDFAHHAFGEETPIPIYVDDEGTPGRDAVIIENGILRTYMHDRSSAAHFGVEPTGNARAYDYSDEPLIRMRNTVIMPGKSKLEDMIAAIDDGYILSYPANGQGDSNGEFMFGAGFGMEIKKGKLARPVRGATLSGICFDLLKTVDMVSDDMNWRSGGICGKKTIIATAMGGPAIKCKANIGGR